MGQFYLKEPLESSETCCIVAVHRAAPSVYRSPGGCWLLCSPELEQLYVLSVCSFMHKLRLCLVEGEKLGCQVFCLSCEVVW